MNPFELEKNSTTKFLLPIMFPHTTYEELIANYFEEAYIGILDEQKYDDTIVLKFNYNNFTEDLKAEVEEMLNLSGSQIREVADNILCYGIPKEAYDDYEHFLHGRWSKLSTEAKANILDFWGQDEESVLNMILNKKARNDGARNLLKHYVKEDILEQLEEMKVVSGEIWPPPNVLIDEMLFEEF